MPDTKSWKWCCNDIWTLSAGDRAVSATSYGMICGRCQESNWYLRWTYRATLHKTSCNRSRAVAHSCRPATTARETPRLGSHCRGVIHTIQRLARATCRSRTQRLSTVMISSNQHEPIKPKHISYSTREANEGHCWRISLLTTCAMIMYLYLCFPLHACCILNVQLYFLSDNLIGHLRARFNSVEFLFYVL